VDGEGDEVDGVVEVTEVAEVTEVVEVTEVDGVVEVTEVRSGRWTLNVVDHPGVSTMSTNPSCASATDLAMARPSPVPGTPISVDEARR
jgi:hypothetical protein